MPTCKHATSTQIYSLLRRKSNAFLHIIPNGKKKSVKTTAKIPFLRDARCSSCPLQSPHQPARRCTNHQGGSAKTNPQSPNEKYKRKAAPIVRSAEANNFPPKKTHAHKKNRRRNKSGISDATQPGLPDQTKPGNAGPPPEIRNRNASTDQRRRGWGRGRGDSSSPGHGAIGLDAVLEAVELPARVPDLDTGLADVDRDALPHGGGLG